MWITTKPQILVSIRPTQSAQPYQQSPTHLSSRRHTGFTWNNSGDKSRDAPTTTATKAMHSRAPQIAQIIEKAQMRNSLTYGGNQLFLFRRTNKVDWGYCPQGAELVHNSVENFVDKMVERRGTAFQIHPRKRRRKPPGELLCQALVKREVLYCLCGISTSLSPRPRPAVNRCVLTVTNPL